MTAAVLLVCGLIGPTPEASPAPDVLAAYATARAAAGPGADAQVKLALWCEAHGLKAERVGHLAHALLADPKNATARGLMGLVHYAGRWRSPDEATGTARSDPARVAAVKEYVTRRAETPDKAEAQWNLALWCEAHGLKAESIAHLRATVRLDPSREAAWKHLGYRKEKGRWVNDELAAAARAEAEAQRHADHKWRPLLAKSWESLHDRAPSRREQARAALDAVIDPRAVPVVWSLFATGDAARQAEAVGILSRIDGPAASRALAALAVYGRDAEVRRAAAETLPRRDFREFADLLVSFLRDRIKYDVKPVDGLGKSGELIVQGAAATLKRVYTPLPPPWTDPNAVLRFDDRGQPVVLQPDGFDAFIMLPEPAGGYRLVRMLPEFADAALARRDAIVMPPSGVLRPNYLYFLPRDAVTPLGQLLRDAESSAATARQQLDSDAGAIDRVNEEVGEINRRSITVLARVAGHDFGDDRDAWQRWAADLKGYAFLAQMASPEKPTIVEQVPVDYQPQAVPSGLVNGPPVAFAQLGHSCFAAGTAVRTLDGLRPIETVAVGDQALVQDGTTGALSYRPVLTAFHNPPSPTLRVRFDDDNGAVVATGIHRFWKAGAGWVMARELKPGDRVRTVGGVATVSAVEPDRTQPVFNLEVASGQSFFVGRLGALVHDNSLVLPVADPFDAPAAESTRRNRAEAR